MQEALVHENMKTTSWILLWRVGTIKPFTQSVASKANYLKSAL